MSNVCFHSYFLNFHYRPVIKMSHRGKSLIKEWERGKVHRKA